MVVAVMPATSRGYTKATEAAAVGDAAVCGDQGNSVRHDVKLPVVPYIARPGCRALLNSLVGTGLGSGWA